MMRDDSMIYVLNCSIRFSLASLLSPKKFDTSHIRHFSEHHPHHMMTQTNAVVVFVVPGQSEMLNFDWLCVTIDAAVPQIC